MTRPASGFLSPLSCSQLAPYRTPLTPHKSQEKDPPHNFTSSITSQNHLPNLENPFKGKATVLASPSSDDEDSSWILMLLKMFQSRIFCPSYIHVARDCWWIWSVLHIGTWVAVMKRDGIKGWKRAEASFSDTKLHFNNINNSLQLQISQVVHEMTWWQWSGVS